MMKCYEYENELTDDFGTGCKHPRPLPKNYRYVHRNIFFRFGSFLLYRCVVRPLAWCYVKCRFSHRFVGKSTVRKLGRQGCFVYANHVTVMGDAFFPNLLSFKKRNYIITGVQTNSLTPLLPLLNALGSIPLGESTAQQLRMLKCIKRRIGEGASITIYPEAHVWPFYTGIRPYTAASFHYPAMLGAPVICATTCFQKKRFGKTPRAVTYLDGPFYPKSGATRTENAKALRDICYRTMQQRATEHSTYACCEYRKKGGTGIEEKAQ